MKCCSWRLLSLTGASFLVGFAGGFGVAWVRERLRSVAVDDPDEAPRASGLDPHRPLD